MEGIHMRCRINCKRFYIIFVLLSVIYLIGGCSTGSNYSSKPKTKTPVNSNEQQKQDRELTGKVIKEEHVLNASVEIKEKEAFAAVVLKDNAPNEVGRKITEKYAKELKNKYKNKKIIVQVIKNGNSIAVENLN
jgi:preprotein translocase subunit SecF